METKFTKGEWKILSEYFDENGGGFYNIGVEGPGWIAEAMGTHVGPKNTIECYANAKLICAAPDMYAILNEICETMKSDTHCVNKYASLLMDAKKAIKKATK